MSAADMEMGRLSSEGNALFTWFCRLPFFQRSGRQITLDNFSDGTLFWEALQELNPDFFAGDLPEGAQSAGRWVNNLQNLKRVYKLLRQYLMEVNKAGLPQGAGEINIRAIAEGSDDEDIVNMLKWISVAASASPSNDEFIHTMLELSPEYQSHMMKTITAFNAGSDQGPDHGRIDDAVSDEPSLPKGPVGSELYNEEMYGKLVADNRRLEMEKKDLQREARNLDNRNNRLVENIAAIREDLRTAQDKAEQASVDQDGQARIKLLEAKVQNLEDHISDQELRLEEALNQQESLTTENNRLKSQSEKLQPLQDSFDEVKRERDQLARRVNLLDKYRSKVEEQKDLEQQNEDLRRELDEIKRDGSAGEGGDDLRARNIVLERQAIELQTLVSSSEMQLMDAQTRRKAIEDRNEELRDEVEDIRKKLLGDAEHISSLESQLDAIQSGAVGLDKELEGSDEQEDKYITDHELEPPLTSGSRDVKVKTPNSSAVQYQALQQVIDEQKASYADLEKKYFAAYKQKLAYEEAMKNPEFKGSQVFQETMAKIAANEAEINELKKEKDSIGQRLLEQEKISMQEVFEDVIGENANYLLVSILDKDKVEALEKLKEFNSEELREKEMQIAQYGNKVNGLTTDLDQHRKMLSEMLMSRGHPGSAELPEEKLKELDEARAAEIRELIEQAGKGKEDSEKKDQKLADSDREILDLKALLKQEQDRAAPTLLKASAQARIKQENDNLNRENKLMTTAFYDLSSRLQMNNVSLQRRTEAPKSFLNRQRALVNQATAVRTR